MYILIYSELFYHIFIDLQQHANPFLGIRDHILLNITNITK